MSNKISYIIECVCRDLGIKYKSKNKEYKKSFGDAQKLGDIYLQLKTILGDLVEIEERHPTLNLHKKFESIIKEIDEADHELIRLAKEIKHD